MPLTEQANLEYRSDRRRDKIWLGEALATPTGPLGYEDERHVCLVSGTGGGKGTGSIIPTLCLWPGSAIVLDIKGENAPITARRRGNGSDYSVGMGQSIHILDPYNVIAGFDDLKSCLNPLDMIDINSETAVRDAGLIAGGLVVDTKDAFFDQWAKDLLAALILHVLTFPDFKEARNLVTVRELVSGGHIAAASYLEALDEKQGLSNERDPFSILWHSMRRNDAFEGFISRMASSILKMDGRTSSSILASASTNTYFLEGAPMRRQVSSSSFNLSDLKKNPKGTTVYLTVPRRYLGDDFRWLRVIINLSISEMERVDTEPATGHSTLFLLDEFASLKKMKIIEDSVAQGRGAGIKFFFVVQNYGQLADVYGKAWENFVSNSGLLLAFHVIDNFTRDYLSKKIGNKELITRTATGSKTFTQTEGKSRAFTKGNNASDSFAVGRGRNSGSGHTFGDGKSSFNFSGGSNTSFTKTTTYGRSSGITDTYNSSDARGTSEGYSETAHSRPLCHPDEIERCFARVDDSKDPAHPGLLLALMAGKRPLSAGRINYFDSEYFAGLFDPHPLSKYKTPPTLKERAALAEQKLKEKIISEQNNKKSFNKLVFSLVIALIISIIATTVSRYLYMNENQSSIIPNKETSVAPPKPTPVLTPCCTALPADISPTPQISPPPKKKSVRSQKCTVLNGERFCD